MGQPGRSTRAGGPRARLSWCFGCDLVWRAPWLAGRSAQSRWQAVWRETAGQDIGCYIVAAMGPSPSEPTANVRTCCTHALALALALAHTPIFGYALGHPARRILSGRHQAAREPGPTVWADGTKASVRSSTPAHHAASRQHLDTLRHARFVRPSGCRRIGLCSRRLSVAAGTCAQWQPSQAIWDIRYRQRWILTSAMYGATNRALPQGGAWDDGTDSSQYVPASMLLPIYPIYRPSHHWDRWGRCVCICVYVHCVTVQVHPGHHHAPGSPRCTCIPSAYTECIYISTAPCNKEGW